jgi:hypothetical protein
LNAGTPRIGPPEPGERQHDRVAVMIAAIRLWFFALLSST